MLVVLVDSCCDVAIAVEKLLEVEADQLRLDAIDNTLLEVASTELIDWTCVELVELEN